MKPEATSPPAVTVVIPAYNRGRCIAEAIQSVLDQKTPFSYEILVVDDGSTDDTAAVAASFGSPVRVITKQNGGPASARNAGVLAARSSLIAFLDSDDLMVGERLARQTEFLLSHPEVVLAFGDILVDPDPDESRLRAFYKLPFVPGQWLLLDNPYQRLLTGGNCVTNVTVMFRRHDYIEAGMMNESLRVSEDWDLWPRMSSRGKFAYCCAPFARVRRVLQDNLMASGHMDMDMARALHGMLLRDRILTNRERRRALALFRILLRQRLRYDLLERGRRYLLEDLREMGSRFGPLYVMGWWWISLIPPPLARCISQLRAKCCPRA